MATVVDTFAQATRAHAAGKLPWAEELCWSVLAEEPGHADALHLVGLIAHQQGNLSRAIDYLNRSLLLDGVNALTCLHLGDVHFAEGNVRAAVAFYERALGLYPDFGAAHNNLGVALQGLQEWAQSLPFLEQAVRLMPTSAAAYNNLGISLKALGRLAQAVEAFEQAQARQPDDAQIIYNLAVSVQARGELARAARLYRAALNLKPDYAEASNNLASVLKEQGLLDEAIGQFRKTLKIEPALAIGYYNLSEFVAEERYRFTPQEIECMQALRTSKTCTAADRSLCCFALAAAKNQQCAYDEAFAYYREANEQRLRLLRESNRAFDAHGHEALIDRAIAGHDKAYFERVREWGTRADMPIFIVGMQRSGSTLVEQILASHPDVFGAGEIGTMPRFMAGAPTAARADHAVPLVADKRQADAHAAAYLRLIEGLGQGARRVTNKTLENYLHLGLIATLFPQARIIHCRRDPLDVCLSCYFQNFLDVPFAWSLEDIAAYHRAYERLMAHWARVLPVAIHEVRYEELVQNQERVTRALLAYCGLDWHERCLDFFHTRRDVRTASAIQVRKPLSLQAIGRWRHYQAHLGPLFKAFGWPKQASPTAPPEFAPAGQASAYVDTALLRRDDATSA
jgi:tetratricopeptide (TPR) repeat protein